MKTLNSKSKLAILNRGESAMRFIRAIRDYNALNNTNLKSVVLLPLSDKGSSVERYSDEVIWLNNDNKKIYKVDENLITLLKNNKIDGLWPGWGFESENHLLPSLLEQNNIIFIGPDSNSMFSLGDKIKAKEIAEDAGLPVIPWAKIENFSLQESSEERLKSEVKKIGYPLMVKASSGGGGRGIRIVQSDKELFKSVRSVLSEVSGEIFLERYMDVGRHIEVQIMGDGKGNVAVFGLRDCSLQRRHQKVLEETPPMNLSNDLMLQLQNWSKKLAEKVKYRSAGTVEFLLDKDSNAWFMEMNPRLQVEHTITEESFGVDLPCMQISVAFGKKLDISQYNPLKYAVEARIYAEDPSADFLPSPGFVKKLDFGVGPGIRIDSGIQSGDTILGDFDAMIAKVIATGSSRNNALFKLQRALCESRIVIENGSTNLKFLSFLISRITKPHGIIDTSYIENNVISEYKKPPKTIVISAFVAAAILEYDKKEKESVNNFAVRPTLTANSESSKVINLSIGSFDFLCEVFRLGKYDYLLKTDRQKYLYVTLERNKNIGVLHYLNNELEVEFEAKSGEWRVFLKNYEISVKISDKDVIRSPSPAMVTAVHVKDGDKVHTGDILFTLEAMKMEIPVSSFQDGKIEKIEVRAGSQVFAGDVLAGFQSGGKYAKQQEIKLKTDEITIKIALKIIKAALFGFDISDDEYEFAFKVLASSKEMEILKNIKDIYELIISFSKLVELTSTQKKFELKTLSTKKVASRTILAELIKQPGVIFYSIPNEYKELLKEITEVYGIDLLEPGFPLISGLYRLKNVINQVSIKRKTLNELLAFLLGMSQIPDNPPFEMAKSLLVLTEDKDGDSEQTDLAENLRYKLFDLPILKNHIKTAENFIKNFLGESSKNTINTSYKNLLTWLKPENFTILLEKPSSTKVMKLIAEYLWGDFIKDCNFYNYQNKEFCFLSLYFSGTGINTQNPTKRLLFTQNSQSLGEILKNLSNFPVHFDSVDLILKDKPENFHNLQTLLNSHNLDFSEITFCILSENTFYTYRSPIGGAFVEDSRLYGLHPAVAARLDLWKFSEFDLKPMKSPFNIYLFEARAKKQPDDTRLIAMAEVKTVSEIKTEVEKQEILNNITMYFRLACQSIRNTTTFRVGKNNLHWNHLIMHINRLPKLSKKELFDISERLTPYGKRLGLEQTIVNTFIQDSNHKLLSWYFKIRVHEGEGLLIDQGEQDEKLIMPSNEEDRLEIKARRKHLKTPATVLGIITRDINNNPTGFFEQYDVLVDPSTGHQRIIKLPKHQLYDSGIVFGILSIPTKSHPEGLKRVTIISNPLKGMGSLSENECRKILGAFDLAHQNHLSIYWIPVSAGAKIDFETGTENLDWTARVLKKIVNFTEQGGIVDILIGGVNVGAQSYFDAEATMISSVKGFLVMTENASIVLTGKRALDASGSVSAENNMGIGGGERIMLPSGQVQAVVKDFVEGHNLLLKHADLILKNNSVNYVETTDPSDRDITSFDYPISLGHGFSKVGALFNEKTNPGRKKVFSVRPVMDALKDTDAYKIERWNSFMGAENTVVWETRIGGYATGLIGIEAVSIPRLGTIPPDGPETWTASTLFPNGSYKIARAISSFSGQVPLVILANLAGFDGSPESMRKWQLIHGAEIGRALVNFVGPVLLVVLSRYHGGAYVVFSTALNKKMEAIALDGSFASVIGGGAAASVVYASKIKRETENHPKVLELKQLISVGNGMKKMKLESKLGELKKEISTELKRKLAEKFDAVHSVERAAKVGSLKEVISPIKLRPYIIDFLYSKLK